MSKNNVKDQRIVFLVDKAERVKLDYLRARMARTRAAVLRLALSDLYNKVETLETHEAILLDREDFNEIDEAG